MWTLQKLLLKLSLSFAAKLLVSRTEHTTEFREDEDIRDNEILMVYQNAEGRRRRS